ncbi:MAG: MTAP family purine nucleoside phosphorylase [Candidatus Aminicenantes bacterium]|nr:MTAP family purine nucleoside phosphorylase [Candidatus Aminicenantes bacterium]
MIDLAVISGSGFYDFPGLDNAEDKDISTRYGEVIVHTGKWDTKMIAFIARHGKGHSLLPNMINYRANLLALRELGAKAILATTVCGVLDASLPLAEPVVFSDLYFPENRLPNGELCSVFAEEGDLAQGHLIFDKPFSNDLRKQIIAAAGKPLTEAVYAHVNGPRFNSKPEIRALQEHASFVSQTAGPEIVIAGELEIPIAVLGYGVDYANGVLDRPTPVEVLQSNLSNSKNVFLSIITKVIQNYAIPTFGGFIYRFG